MQTTIFQSGALGNRYNRPLSKEACQPGARPLTEHTVAQLETLIRQWKRAAEISNWEMEVAAYVASVRVARRELAMRAR